MEVSLIQHMGSDKSVVNAARVSFNKTADQYTDEQNRSLIYFLARGMSSKEFTQVLRKMEHGLDSIDEAFALWQKTMHQSVHWTAFAQTGITLHCKAPISIVRQLYKHKIGLVENEVSRRYVSDTPEYFVPKAFRARPDGSIKQGSAGIHKYSHRFLELYIAQCDAAVELYDRMIAEGISPEQARFVLPQSMYTEWQWTGNLYSLASMFNTRFMDSHAQEEVRDFARLVGKVVEPLFPISWDALTSLQLQV